MRRSCIAASFRIRLLMKPQNCVVEAVSTSRPSEQNVHRSAKVLEVLSGVPFSHGEECFSVFAVFVSTNILGVWKVRSRGVLSSWG